MDDYLLHRLGPRCPRCAAVLPWVGWTWKESVCPTCCALVRAPRRALITGLALMAAAFPIQLAARLLLRQGSWPSILIFAGGIGVMAFGISLVLRSRRKLDMLHVGPFCPRCTYDLSAHSDRAKCPECGAERPGGVAWVVRDDRSWML